jgi:hypothetical protein
MKPIALSRCTGLFFFSMFAFCSKESPTNPPLTYGVICGKILKASDSAGIASANVMVYNANTNSPVGRTLTDTHGNYLLTVDPGVYYLKITAQNFLPLPPAYGAPLPFDAVVNDTVRKDLYLLPDPAAAQTSSISGTVSTGSAAVGGALVVVTRTADSLAFSGVSGPDGYYVLYNIPAGSYSVKAYLAGYTQSVDTQCTVTLTAASSGMNLHVASATGARLSGKITFLASQNSRVDITLVNPYTREAIPGLSTLNDASLGYSLTGIPPGTYIAWATYRNDGYVMDPDWIRKNGLPFVTFSAGDSLKTADFSVTGAVSLVAPTNADDSVFAVTVATDKPVFSWQPYPAAKEYIVEVLNSRGEVIWGGFDQNGVVRLRSQIFQHQDSVVFNFDSSATGSLKNGEIYRWKVYADNDAARNVQGLISASEDCKGLFKVRLP